METIVKAMAAPDSGLDVRDRMWLKITIPKAFIGVDVVDWLTTHVQGFQDRKEAKKYANQLLKAGLIRHTVNKLSFSEQCYYVFSDLSLDMCSLRLQEEDEEGGAGGMVPPWGCLGPLLPAGYVCGSTAAPSAAETQLASYVNYAREGSTHSGSGGSGGPPAESSRSVDGAEGSQELTGSRQSFRMAMGNPCELFVDVM
ncbi:hypothetical protein HPB50_022886 [Hyalomma asiaticum]|nr:hypothetical protein HPB50_022886 [Hyalomma asiaticum]